MGTALEMDVEGALQGAEGCLQFWREIEKILWKMLYLTKMRELSYHGESVQRAKVLTQEETVEWEERKMRQ